MHLWWWFCKANETWSIVFRSEFWKMMRTGSYSLEHKIQLRYMIMSFIFCFSLLYRLVYCCTWTADGKTCAPPQPNHLEWHSRILLTIVHVSELCDGNKPIMRIWCSCRPSMREMMRNCCSSFIGQIESYISLGRLSKGILK